MSAGERPVLAALARAAVELTGAAGAAVLALRGEEITVLAAGGGDARTVGARLGPQDDAVRLAFAAGNSLALAPAEGAAPPSLCVLCDGGNGVVGALELRGGAGAGPFGADATRVAELLADVVAAELAADRGRSADPPSPGELGAELAQLAARDRSRYEAIAQALGALLAGG